MPANSASAARLQLTPPNGLGEIVAAFGNIFNYISADGVLNPAWESEHLGRVSLPFPIPLAGNSSKLVKNLYCHKKMIDVFPEVLAAVEKEKLKGHIRTCGGCFNFRSKRNSDKISSHAWGIAIDLNPETNALGKPGDMSPEIVDIFRNFGFKWGGDWPDKNKDPMHFQFCTGY